MLKDFREFISRGNVIDLANGWLACWPATNGTHNS